MLHKFVIGVHLIYRWRKWDFHHYIISSLLGLGWHGWQLQPWKICSYFLLNSSMRISLMILNIRILVKVFFSFNKTHIIGVIAHQFRNFCTDKSKEWNSSELSLVHVFKSCGCLLNLVVSLCVMRLSFCFELQVNGMSWVLLRFVHGDFALMDSMYD